VAGEVTPLRLQQLKAAASEVAARVAGKLDQLWTCSDTSADGADCGASFVAQFAARAFRRTLTEDESSALSQVTARA